MRKSIYGIAAAMALSCTSAVQAGQINFNPLGSGNLADNVYTDAFDWGPANLLFDGCFPAAGQDCLLRGHALLSDFLLNSNPLGAIPAGIQISMVFEIPINIVAIAAGGLDINLTVGGGAGIFQIWQDDVAGGGTGANVITGANYGDGTLILEASVNQGFNGAPVIDNSCEAGGTCLLLDNGPNGADNSGPAGNAGTTTASVGGNLNFGMEVTYQDMLFFLDPLAVPMIADLTLDPTTVAQFLTTEPSDLVGMSGPSGVSPAAAAGLAGGNPDYGSDNHNDGNCPTPDTCDLHVQGDATTSFAADFPRIPEPGSLALLGLGLLGAAAARRVKRSV